MKKLLCFLFLSFVFIPAASAAEAFSEWGTTADQQQIKILAPLHIRATQDSEIKAIFGIRIYLDSLSKVLWEPAASLEFSGTAVGNGRISDSVIPQYSLDKKSIFIPVLQDWIKDEELVIENLTIRTYKNSIENKFLSIDLNGDDTFEATDNAFYRITTNISFDQVKPFEPIEFNGAISDDLKSITLKWINAPDYDLKGVILKRIVKRNDQEITNLLLDGDLNNEYTDFDIQAGDQINYKIVSLDVQGNTSPEKELIMIVQAPVVDQAPTPTPDLKTYLESKFGSYKLRYQIKCTPSGRTVSEGDSACLWAKIDLVYAQAQLARQDLPVALSARDLELMALRLPFSQKRYETQCIKATEPASYCTALGKALDRAEYFLGN